MNRKKSSRAMKARSMKLIKLMVWGVLCLLLGSTLLFACTVLDIMEIEHRTTCKIKAVGYLLLLILAIRTVWKAWRRSRSNRTNGPQSCEAILVRTPKSDEARPPQQAGQVRHAQDLEVKIKEYTEV